MNNILKKLILVLVLLVIFEHIIKESFWDNEKTVRKYEYKGKYKDEKKERIVEHIGE